MTPTDSPGLARTDAWVFVLPEGWARFPTGEGRDRELDRAIDQVITRVMPADVPRDRMLPVRRLLDTRLRSAIDDARQTGAGAVYLPIAPVNGVIVPGSIVEVEFDSDPGSDPTDVARSVLSDGYEESESLEIDDQAAVRLSATHHEVPQKDDPDIAFSSYQVVYVINRDAERGAWLALSFSVIWNSAETRRLADALVLFFDAVMTTFRWAGGTDVPDAPSASVPGSTPMKDQDPQ